MYRAESAALLKDKDLRRQHTTTTTYLQWVSCAVDPSHRHRFSALTASPPPPVPLPPPLLTLSSSPEARLSPPYHRCSRQYMFQVPHQKRQADRHGVAAYRPLSVQCPSYKAAHLFWQANQTTPHRRLHLSMSSSQTDLCRLVALPQAFPIVYTHTLHPVRCAILYILGNAPHRRQTAQWGHLRTTAVSSFASLLSPWPHVRWYILPA